MKNSRQHPLTGQLLLNYWGYSTPASSHRRVLRCYRSIRHAGHEVKNLIRNCTVGIEVILNAEPIILQRRSSRSDNLVSRNDNKIYYILTPNGYTTTSGCGNTLNCNHPVAEHGCGLSAILGFRLSPMVPFRSLLILIATKTERLWPTATESLALDPVLHKRKLIAEA
jgi:glycogen operon protein